MTRNTNQETLNTEQIEAFERDGYLLVEWLIDGELLRRVHAGYSKAVNGEIDVEGWRERMKPDALLQLPGPSEFIPELQDRAHIDAMVAVARQLMGEGIGFWYDQLIFKPAGNPFETPWHQDAGYWRSYGQDFPAVTAWLAVEDVDEDMGCMSFAPGSHKGDIVEHRSVADTSPISGALEVAVLPDTAVRVPMKAGDVSFHHSRTLHYTQGNHGSRGRMGLVNHLCDTAIRAEHEAAAKRQREDC